MIRVYKCDYCYQTDVDILVMVEHEKKCHGNPENKMNKQTIEYYDWFDIEKEICKEMGIEEQYFRDYHKLVGGEYKDLWHEWMRYFESNVYNGVITENDSSYWEGAEHKIEWVKNDGKDWLEPFVNAVYKVFDEFEIEYIKYYW